MNDTYSLVVCVVAILFLAVVVGLSIYASIYNTKNHVKKDHVHLKKDAKIIGFDTKVVGAKGERVYRTTVTFDDGFQYVSHDTRREDNFLSYTITLTKDMKEGIINRAVGEHCRALGIPMPSRDRHYKCKKCGFEGRYVINCPECGSDQKIELT